MPTREGKSGCHNDRGDRNANVVERNLEADSEGLEAVKGDSEGGEGRQP